VLLGVGGLFDGLGPRVAVGLIGTRCDCVEPGGQRHAELREEGLHILGNLSGLADARLAAVVFNNLDAVELRDEVAPGVTGADLGDAFEQEREDGEADVRLDPPRPVVEDRAHAKTGLELTPALLDPAATACNRERGPRR
jgi:hypothetical protein